MIIIENRTIMVDHDDRQRQQLYNTRMIQRPKTVRQISKVFCISFLCIFVFVIQRRWMLITLGDTIIQRSIGSNYNLILKNDDVEKNNLNINIINNNNNNVDNVNNNNNKNITSQQQQHTNNNNNQSNNQSSSHHHRHKNNDYKGLAIITAFNHKDDDFKGTGRINATFDYISKWYRSVQKFPNTIKGAVIHNMYTEEQILNWTTKQIGFVQTSNTTKTYLRGINRPINDMRFFVLNTALWNIIKPENINKYPPYVLISDAHDIQFLRNPFDYMETLDNIIGKPQLYVGEESLWGKRKLVYDNYMNSSSISCFNKYLKTTPSRMVNCGIIGGRTNVVSNFLSKLTIRLDQAKPHKVCDQISLFYTLKEEKEYQNKYISGYPFNTIFKKYETSNETDAYIAHK